MAGKFRGLRAIALLEASKGCLALAVGFGLHYLAGQNVQQLAEQFVAHLHLNVAKHYPAIFIAAAGELNNSRLTLLAIGAMAYAIIRLVEAYGLWHSLCWTEWFALLSGAIYLPFEIYELFEKLSWPGMVVFLINILVVAYMTHIIFGQHKQAA